MKKQQFSEEQMIAAVKQMNGGRAAAEIGRELGVSKHTIYAWNQKYGGMSGDDARRLRQVEDENRRLKQLVADLTLDREALKTVIQKNVWSAVRLQAETVARKGLRKCIRPVYGMESLAMMSSARAGLITARQWLPVFSSGLRHAGRPFRHRSARNT